ncbi:unnamed protein product [Pleuronectes platessa]|uniref:Uncharacterized protein n=1 Tax=Pleuronectes platessa TaxID=8262 RepID=A0A9N7VZ68_PLEPL|nr:unnamed protein product [Pleuronectes platessa]
MPEGSKGGMQAWSSRGRLIDKAWQVTSSRQTCGGRCGMGGGPGSKGLSSWQRVNGGPLHPPALPLLYVRSHSLLYIMVLRSRDSQHPSEVHIIELSGLTRHNCFCAACSPSVSTRTKSEPRKSKTHAGTPRPVDSSVFGRRDRGQWWIDGSVGGRTALEAAGIPLVLAGMLGLAVSDQQVGMMKGGSGERYE